jgi:hypothetical protein
MTFAEAITAAEEICGVSRQRDPDLVLGTLAQMCSELSERCRNAEEALDAGAERFIEDHPHLVDDDPLP